MLRTSNGGCRVVAAPFSADEPRGELGDCGSARIDLVRAAGRDQVDLAGGAVAAAMELAPEDQPGAEAGTDREEDEVLHPARDPLPALADGRQVDVVLDGDGKTQPVANVVTPESSLEAGDVRREPELSGVRIDDAGDADDRAVDQLSGEPARLGERVSEHADRLDRSVGVGSVELDVLARSHVAAQVADRAAQEAGAEVEAEDERGLRNEVEEDGAVRGPAGVRLGLLHQSRLEERLQRERDRRLRDAGAARDLGPRDGRSVADRLEHRALVQVLQQRRDCGGAWHRGSGHLVKNLTRFAGRSQPNLTS